MERAQTIAPGVLQLDLEYLGRPRWIATAAITGGDGVALIDPGPSSSLPGLRTALGEAGLTLNDVRWVVLTHIHLDHAGATGTLVRENPRIRVIVQERGAPHVVDPARLLASASRIYGSAMERLWGEVAAVPEEAVHDIAGGETIDVAGRSLETAYTPGHASHHASYYDPESGLGFVGDTGGIRIGGAAFALPVTPPPDIDVELWETSLDRIAAWHPDRLFVTHFGACPDAAWHLDALRRGLRSWAERVRVSLQEPGTDEERAAAFARWVSATLRESLDEETAREYEASGSFEDDWVGLARYWRRKQP